MTPEQGNLAAVHKYRKVHPDRVKAYKKDWAGRHPDKLREYGRRSRLVQTCKLAGITVEQYERALERSGGFCEICGKRPEKRRISIDHGHKTGKFRGLICNRCNTILGLSDDSSTILYKCANYLLERGS